MYGITLGETAFWPLVPRDKLGEVVGQLADRGFLVRIMKGNSKAEEVNQAMLAVHGIPQDRDLRLLGLQNIEL